MQNPYSEDQLVEQPTIALLASLGWETMDCYNEFDQGSSPLGQGEQGRSRSDKEITRRLGTAQS